MWSIVIRICVDDYRQPTKSILAAENWPRNHAIFCIPNGETVAKQILSFAGDLKAHDDFPVAVPAGNLVPDSAAHRLLVGRQAHVGLCKHHRSSVVPIWHGEAGS